MQTVSHLVIVAWKHLVFESMRAGTEHVLTPPMIEHVCFLVSDSWIRVGLRCWLVFGLNSSFGQASLLAALSVGFAMGFA